MDRQGRKRGEKENVIGVGVCLGCQRLTAYFRSYTPLTLFLFPFQGFSYRSLPPPVPYAEPALSIYSSLPFFLHSFHLLLIYFTNHLLETTMPHLQGAQKNEQKTEATSKPQVRTLIIEHENLKYISWVCLKLGCCLFWCQPFLTLISAFSFSQSPSQSFSSQSCAIWCVMIKTTLSRSQCKPSSFPLQSLTSYSSSCFPRGPPSSLNYLVCGKAGALRGLHVFACYLKDIWVVVFWVLWTTSISSILSTHNLCKERCGAWEWQKIEKQIQTGEEIKDRCKSQTQTDYSVFITASEQ